MPSDPSHYLPADALPGLLDGWCGPVEIYMRGEWVPYCVDPWHVGPQFSDPGSIGQPRVEGRLDARRWEVRCLLSRRVAELLGVPVGVTAPGWRRCGAREWRLTGVAPGGQVVGLARIEDTERRFHPDKAVEWIEKRHPGLCIRVQSLDAIPLHDPDSDALALVAVARWLGDEIRAGRQ